MRQRLHRWGGVAVLALALAACGGDDGAQGPAGPPGPSGQDADAAALEALQRQVTELTQAANPETCALCHSGDTPTAQGGSGHQDRYDQFYQDDVMAVADMALVSDGVATTTLTFKLTKNGAAFDCRKTQAFAIGGYWAAYDIATKTFPTGALSLKPAAAGIGWDPTTNVCTFTKTYTAAADLAKVAQVPAANGVAMVYGTDEILVVNAERHLTLGKYPFAGVLKMGTVDYASAANVANCESCHTQPYLKHGYIYGDVDGLEFYTCKACHFDTRDGSHQDWQILHDDPDRYAEIAGGSPMTAEERAKYAYTATVMNDTHMSHAMEFGYPQSMANCVGCHEGKLDRILADAQFTAETCRSCHAIDGLKTMMAEAAFDHATMLDNPFATNCTTCHRNGGVASSFREIKHGGYDPLIYTETGVRYSDTFVVTIDSASLTGNVLTFAFSAAESPDVAGMAAADIEATVLVGPYGYDTKDFIVAAHGRDAERNRLLEYVVGTTHPRFTTVRAANGQWQVTADLSQWADKIADGTIKRVEIAVLPLLRNPEGGIVGLNSPSRTFSLRSGAFDDSFYGDIVQATKCNNCHDQLSTTFHNGSYGGGNIVVCRICHEVSSPGSHLEVQSRSIDSYMHAVHSFQVFDPGEIDFADPAESVEYEHHVSSQFPRFGIMDCESCHVAGTYEVPDQSKSMPGVLSGTDAIEGRRIGAIPATVTGPAVRACGGCHRAHEINEDDAGGLAVLQQHFKSFGYVIENAQGLWASIVDKMMALFE